MKYLAFLYDDVKKTMEILLVKDARNLTEARVRLKQLIEHSANPTMRIVEVYGVNQATTVDAICSILVTDGQTHESIFNQQKALL